MIEVRLTITGGKGSKPALRDQIGGPAPKLSEGWQGRL
jgi:hypothetical protein